MPLFLLPMKLELIQKYIDHLSAINHCLYKEENKPSANIHPSYNLWFETSVKGKVCVGFYSNDRVRQILETDFPEKLSNKYPDKFNTGNPNDVLDALAKETNLKLLIEESESSQNKDIEKERVVWYSDYYFILTNFDMSKTVRLDLLRLIGNNSQGEIDFKGGLFHAFKHFSQGGLPISHKTEPTELPTNFANKVAEVIFYEEPIASIILPDGNEKHEFEFSIDDKKFRMWVYHNKKCNVFFLDMLRRHS